MVDYQVLPSKVNWTYDPNGNILQVGTTVRHFGYDGEDRQVSATINGNTATYAYDGDGLRVSKTVGGQTTIYVYDAFGNLAAEYGGSAVSPCGVPTTCYLMTDHLGSTRLMTDNVGSATNVKRYDYLPFGEEILSGVNGRSTSMG